MSPGPGPPPLFSLRTDRRQCYLANYLLINVTLSFIACPKVPVLRRKPRVCIAIDVDAHPALRLALYKASTVAQTFAMVSTPYNLLRRTNGLV